MPVRTDPWPPGTPCWIDVTSPDPTAARELYGSVFGWAYNDSGPEFGNYLMAHVDGVMAAGMGPVQAGAPPAWTVYVATDDIAATLSSVSANGGKIVYEAMEIPGSGTMAIVADPAGAVFGLWQANGHIGSGLYNAPGGLTWSDTNVSDVPAVRAFYGAVFGWTFESVADAPEGYLTYALGGDALGGVGGLGFFPPGTPSHWMPYIGAADTDAVAAAFVTAGGRLLVEPNDSPWGRMAVVADPWGALFTVMQVPTDGDTPS